MTETLVLVFTNPRVGLPDIGEWLRSIGDVVGDGKVVTLESSGRRVHIVGVADPELDAVFEDWPSSLIPNGPTAAFSLDYRDAGLAHSVVRALANNAEILIDNNYGVVMSGVDLDLNALRRR